MTARRIKSLHHNLGNKNVVFHREHIAKKNRNRNVNDVSRKLRKKKLEKLKLEELESEKRRALYGK